MCSLLVCQLCGLMAFVLQVEATLATHTDLNAASVNRYIQEFVDLRQCTVPLIPAFIGEEVPKIIIVEKLVTILCSLFARACLLIFKHCCDSKVNYSTNSSPRSAF